MIQLHTLNSMTVDEAGGLLQQCCAAVRWVNSMVESRPYSTMDQVLRSADSVWSAMGEKDFLQAFDAHPKIGDPASLKKKYQNTHSMAKGEQSGMYAASDQVISDLSRLNDEYHQRFGFIFIVCATGKTADEMLSLISARVLNARHDEILIAAEEQRKITAIRLNNLLTTKSD